MSLLDDVSIVVTPNGYKAGTLYGVIPSSGAADMDVTRATAATRVDENGLVNYAEVLGSELVDDGNFLLTGTQAQNVIGTYWTTGAGWTISGGTANANTTGSFVNLTQNNVFENGKTYKTSFTITNYTQGEIRLTQAGIDISGSQNSLGTYETTFTSSSADGRCIMQGLNSFIGSIDNVSVKEVTRNNVPRIDYTGGGCPHILAEPQRTNLVTYSESISNLSSTTNGTGTLTITDNYTDSPQGLQNASRVQMSIVDTNDTSNYRLINAGSVMITGVTREISFYAKSLTGSNQDVLVYWSYDQQIVTLTNDWQRFKISATSGSSSKVFIGTRGGSGSYFSGGDANLDFALWGLQVEDDGSGGGSSYATSYIPTSGSTVTRNQDQFTRDGIGSLINSTEGVLFAEISALADDGTSKRITISDGTLVNRITLTLGDNNISGFVNVGSSTQYSFFESGITTTDFNKIAIKYKANDFSIWINGVEYDVQTSGSTFSSNTLNRLNFSNATNLSDFFFGKVKQVQVYDTALTDNQLIQLTGEAGTHFFESYSEMAETLTYTIQ